MIPFLDHFFLEKQKSKKGIHTLLPPITYLSYSRPPSSNFKSDALKFLFIWSLGKEKWRVTVFKEEKYERAPD